MMFKVHDDWKRSLSAEDEARLNDILRRTAKHRPAYRSAHDVRIAQLWAAILEIDRDNTELKKKLRKVENIFDVIVKAVEEEKYKKDTLIQSLEKF